MDELQCKKNRNQLTDIRETIKRFDDDNVCLSCLEFDKCREASEQAEIDQESN